MIYVKILNTMYSLYIDGMYIVWPFWIWFQQLESTLDGSDLITDSKLLLVIIPTSTVPYFLSHCLRYYLVFNLCPAPHCFFCRLLSIGIFELQVSLLKVIFSSPVVFSLVGVASMFFFLGVLDLLRDLISHGCGSEMRKLKDKSIIFLYIPLPQGWR